jgi:hypothetical protein
VRVEVAEEQQELEKKHAGGPDGGRASEPGKNHLGDDGLDLKQQESAKKNGEGVQ